MGKETKTKEYRVIYTPDADGVRWNAEIPGKPGGCACLTWGRSIRHARASVREALAVCLDDDAGAEAAVFLEEYRLRGEAARLKGLRARRKKVEQSVRALADESAEVARRLHREGLSLRDIAELVGTSHQRVQQIG